MDYPSAPIGMGDFYQDHRSWLLRWLRARLHCSFTAEDLVQDTFVRLLLAPVPFIIYATPVRFWRPRPEGC